MQALVIPDRDASAEVIDVVGRDPDPGPGEARVAVEAASVNGFDVAVAAGHLWDAMPHEFPVVLGRDFAGVVESVGSGVDSVAVGDRVTGTIHAPSLGMGALGEQVTTTASTLARIPDGVTAEEAAAVGLAAATALDVVNALDVASGDVVLVSGATGGVGVYVVQLSAARGAAVIATARPGAASDALRRLGATHVVDYRGDVVAEVHKVVPDGVPKVVHAAGDVTALASLVAVGGHLVSLLGVTASVVAREDVTVTPLQSKPTEEKLTQLLADVAAGRLLVPIAATYPLAKAADALSAFSGPNLGKIVVTA